MRRSASLAILAILWLVPLLIFVSAFHYGWHATWAGIGIPALVPSFADLRGLTGALITVQHGGDPFIFNPFDPWGRPLNYPRIWIYLFSALGINDGNVPVVGVTFCVLYLACVSVLIFRARRNLDAVVLLIAGLSLAPLLAFERGNIDLLIFAMVFLACALSSDALRSGLLCVAALLKIYPLAAMGADAMRRPSGRRAAPLLLLALVVASFAWQWRDVNTIRRYTPVSGSMSYGAISLKQEFDEDWGPLLGNRVSTGWIAVALLWGAGALAAAGAWTRRTQFDASVRRSPAAGAFFVFGAIYAFSFAVGSNWDYRLIFLLPTLPFALDLARDPDHRRWALAYIAALLVAENAWGLKWANATTLNHAVTFLLFVMMVGALMQLLKLFLYEHAAPPRHAIAAAKIGAPLVS